VKTVMIADPDGNHLAFAEADDIALHAWLRNQVLKCCVNVACVRQPVIRFGLAAAFAKSAQIERKRIDSSRRQLPGQFIPRFACAVTLMQQQYAGTRLCRGKVACLEDRPIGSLQFDYMSSRSLLQLWP
jgi:hypothetical protein